MVADGNNIGEEKRLKEWMRAEETVSLGIEISEVRIENNFVNIEGWVMSSEAEGEKHGVLLPLKKDSKNKYRIMMDEATHYCKDVKYRGAVVCRHVRAFAIYVTKNFKEIKKEYNLKGVNLA